MIVVASDLYEYLENQVLNILCYMVPSSEKDRDLTEPETKPKGLPYNSRLKELQLPTLAWTTEDREQT